MREAEIEILERRWERLMIDGEPHPHSFAAGSEAPNVYAVSLARERRKTIQSGVRDLVILKSTGSGFENYPKDEFTTLPETTDRILATSFSATWTFKEQPENYGARERGDPDGDAESVREQLQSIRADDAVSDGRSGAARVRGNFANSIWRCRTNIAS